MKTATLILAIIFLVVFFIIAMLFVIASNCALYCFIFEHKDWKRWEEICKLLPNSSLIKHNVFDDKHSHLNCYVFHIPIVDSIGCPVNVYYWENKNIVSVHHLGDRGCYLCDFDTYHVKKALEIIRHKLNEYEDKIH